MHQLLESIIKLRDRWNSGLANLESKPDLWLPKNLGANTQQVSELLEAFVVLASQIQEPKGFQPHYHVIKAGIIEWAAQGVSSIDQLESTGAVDHCRCILESMSHISLYLKHLEVITGSNESFVAEGLSLRLAEAISLVENGQKQLSAKSDQLALAQAVVANAETACSKIQEYAAAAGEILERVSSFAEKTKKVDVETDELRTKLKEEWDKILITVKENSNEAKLQWESDQIKLNDQIKTLDALRDDSRKLASTLAEQAAEISDTQKTTARQKQLIDELLPKGASAALAEAFEKRASRLERTKWIWLGLFVSSIVVLLCVASGIGIHIVGASTPVAQERKEIWLTLIERLPFVAPLIWLGWFSAVQYGNTIRVQEDYEFKAATSKAFAGYRNHMEHMANVQLTEANSAMLLLAERTIEILAREPLRIYGKADHDASPATSVSESLFRRPKKTEDTSG